MAPRQPTTSSSARSSAPSRTASRAPSKTTSSSREPVGLDPEAIVEAAVSLIDEHGVDAFTIRALSDRLGVSAPTIYWHVGSKAELLQRVVDQVVADIDLSASPRGTWETRLRRFFSAARQQLLAHPNVMDLLRSVHSQAFERWSTVAVDIMSDAGFDDRDAATYGRIALVHMLGAIRSEANVRTAGYMERVAGGTGSTYRVRPVELNPDLDRRVALMTSYDLDTQHELMTAIFLAGIKAQLPSGGR